MIMERYKSGSRRWMAVLVTLILASLLSACFGISQEVSMPTPEPGAEGPPGMANPASVYCEEQGGRLELRTAADGGQFGVCIFSDGSECEEWAYYRGECTPGQSTAAPTPTLADAPAPAPAPDVAVEEILAQIQLPAEAYSAGPAVLPLRSPVASPPLWALYSTGMRNYELDPVPSHFVAIFTKDDDGWHELARVDLDQPPAEDVLLVEPLPDYIDASGVQQVSIDPSRVWLTVDGGAGAHSGVFQVLSFDGQALTLELASSSASPGAGFMADVNQDGQNDVVLNATDPYIFCYACGVRYPYFQVHTWLGDALAPVELAALMMGQRGTAPDEPNSQAVALAQAGLWRDALTKIDEAVALAGGDDPPTAAGSLRWNQALIRLNHDAQLAAIEDSAYPLLNLVFYGDYAGAVDLMRPYGVEEIFSPATALLAGTAAENWQPELSGYLLSSADAALAVQPELAPAYFLRAWAHYLADPARPQISRDLAKAAELAPDDALFMQAAAAQPELPLAPVFEQTPAVRISFAAGGTSASVPGNIAAGEVRRYVLAAGEGQTMAVNVSSPNHDVVLAIWGEDGTVLLSDQAGLTEWQGTLPATQDYYIGLSGAAGQALFRLSVSIPPLGQ
jgi:putative hemolysin